MARPRKGLKLRADPRAKLDYLPYEQHEQLCQWLLTHGVSYEDIRKSIKRKFNVNTSTSAIAQFYKNHVVEHLTAIRARAVNVAAGYLSESVKAPAAFTAATMDALETKAMQAALNPKTNPKDLRVYLELVLRWQEMRIRAEQVQIQLRRLRMLERKQKKLEAIFSVESKLSSDEVAERCRLIFRHNGEIETKSENDEEKLVPPVPPNSPSAVSVKMDNGHVQIQDRSAGEADGQEFPNGV